MRHRLLKLDSGITLRKSLLDLVLSFEFYSNTGTSVAVRPNSRSTSRAAGIIKDDFES